MQSRRFITQKRIRPPAAIKQRVIKSTAYDFIIQEGVRIKCLIIYTKYAWGAGFIGDLTDMKLEV